MRTLVIGVDPGIHGAVGVLEVSDNGIKFVDVFDMPLDTALLKAKKKSRIDFYSLALLLERYTPETVLAVIEDVGFMKGNEARGSAFTFGYATGGITGLLSGLMVTIQKVTPAVWKLGLGLNTDKNLSMEKAKQLFPESTPYLRLKKHDGRAEAILLAYWAAKRMRVAK